MRLDELVLRVPGDEFRVRFHPQLTVLAGIGLLERQVLADGIVDAMSGAAGTSTLQYTDAGGTPIVGIVPAVALRLDAKALRQLVLVQAADLGIEATDGRPNEDPELTEARATLAALTDELQGAMGGRVQVDELTNQLQDVERDIKTADDGRARREYAKILADLERVRAEAAALQGGEEGADTDQQLLESADNTRELASRWREAVRRVALLQSRLISDAPRDRRATAAAEQIPDELPRDLRRLMAEVDSTRHERDTIETELREHAASSLPAPSDPRVVDLATADQTVVWATRDRVVHAAQNMEREQLALGGTGSGSNSAFASTDRPANSTTVERLEATHTVVENAEQAMEAQRTRMFAVIVALVVAAFAAAGLVTPILGVVPLVAAVAIAMVGLGRPAARLAAAKSAEKDVLEQIGASSYMAFHLRRVEASIMPGAHERLEATAREHKAALQAWTSIMPDATVEQAVALEAEARAYARSLAELGDKAGEIEDLRRRLSEVAEPAYERARETLAATLAQFQLEGLTDVSPEEIEVALEEQIARGRDARAHAELDDAEATTEKLSARLNDLLAHLGFRDGSLEARAGALDWAIDRATEREQARSSARSLQEIETDLVQLQDEAQKLRRPEWASVQASEAKLPDAEQLRHRRDELRSKLTEARRSDIDIERLSDRHSAMERRVAALEARHDGGRADAALAQVAKMQESLLEHLTRASEVGPMQESVPVVLDDPFLRIPAERKWELLDMLRRVAEQTQIVYLTDDPFVCAWARRRASAGSITLLEPVEA